LHDKHTTKAIQKNVSKAYQNRYKKQLIFLAQNQHKTSTKNGLLFRRKTGAKLAQKPLILNRIIMDMTKKQHEARSLKFLMSVVPTFCPISGIKVPCKSS